MIEIVIGVVSAIVLALVGLLGITKNKLNNTRIERDAAIDDAESATELANTQSELSRVQQQAREEAKHEKPITRPDANTDFNSL